MQYELITESTRLAEICQYARQQKAVAIDTEFVRTRTLYPQIGLVQLYDGQHLALIDPIVIDDMSAFTELLTDSSVVKVLHSCSEDLETFWRHLGVIPEPIFDSQFAASLLNMGPALGYARLVELCLGISVDKGESRTDWTARPLSDQQCQYAANDVLYLLQLYPQLNHEVEQLGRRQWVYQEMRRLGRRKTTKLADEYAYLQVKNNWKLYGRPLLVLKRLAAWRLYTARKMDLAVNFVLRENNLLAIAATQPASKAELSAIHGILPQQVRQYGAAILEIVAQAIAAPAQHYPPRIERLTTYAECKKISTAIRQVCLEVAAELNIPVELVGSKKQISQVLKWLWFELDETRLMGLTPDLLTGWRQPLLMARLAKIPGLHLEEKMHDKEAE